MRERKRGSSKVPKKKNTISCLVVAHGKSEKKIAEYIKSAFRMRMKIYSESNGRNSIQITSLINYLDSHLGDFDRFLNDFEEDIIVKGRGRSKIIQEFKIFTVMDTDDCTKNQSVAYKNKEMFQHKWYEPYIEPIYNSPDLEEVLIKGKFPYEIDRKNKGEKYLKLFPGEDPSSTKETKIEQLKQASLDSRISNLHNLIEYCEENKVIF